VILNGFRFAGRLATDNICLNRIEHDSKYCYTTSFVNTVYIQKNYWLNVAKHPNVGGILGAGYFQKYT